MRCKAKITTGLKEGERCTLNATVGNYCVTHFNKKRGKNGRNDR